MNVMGLDVSLTSTGLIVLDTKGIMVMKRAVTSKPIGTMVHNRMSRIEKIVQEIKSAVLVEKPSVICIEAYSFGSNTSGNAERIELGGLLRYVLCRECERIYEVAPSTLKKFACGKGNAKGSLPIALALHQRYGVTFETDDEFDAYALARMAFQIAGYEQSANDPQRECIATVTMPKVKKVKKSRIRQ